ncbi:MAG: UvrB/UvrC motif-containing protein, partial [Planctomycetota bacterium]|nr:UvrB/UvrC motif-containing protein [Planctomycetota bacterium]
EGEMLSAAEALDFEKAAEIRDRIRALKNEDGTESPTDVSETTRGARPRRSRGKGRVPRPKRP